MVRRTTLMAVAVLGVCAMTLPAFAADRDFTKIETVKIGVLAPVNLVPGIGIVNAAQMAADKINAKGGVHGKKIQLVIGDTEANPEKGITALKKLVLEDNVDVLIGTFSSGVALAQMPFATNYKTVFITTGAASIDITDRVAKDYNRYKYTFRFMINSRRQGEAVGEFTSKFVAPKYGVKKVAVVAENAKWAQDEAPVVKKKLEEAGLEVPFYEFFDVDIKDFSPLFARIQRSGAQWVTQFVSHSSSVPFVKGWADSKGLPMAGCDVQGMDGTFWERTEGKALGVTTFNFMSRSAFTPNTIPFWDEYVERYKAKGYTPVYTSGFTYDIVFMLAQVIAEKRSVKSQDLIDGLEAITYQGVTSTNAGFQKNDHDIRAGAYHLPFIQWQAGGKQVVVWPANMKTGDLVLPAWKR